MIQAGFATTDITPEIGAHIPGGFAPRESTGTVDPLQARACVIAGADETVAFVGVDAVSLRFDTIDKARAQIESACGIAPRNVLIAASHTHSGGPANDVLGTDSDDAYCDRIAAAIAASVTAAHQGRVDAEIGSASAPCEGWGFNRRWLMRSGGEGSNPGKNNEDKIEPAGPVDPDVAVIAVRSTDGKLLGAVGNYTCHCTVVGGTKFSADYPAYWQKALRERTSDDFTLVFANGACGDINQIDFANPDSKESGVEWAERMGQALADATMACVESARFASDAKVASAHGGVWLSYRRPTPGELTNARRLLDSDEPWHSKKWQARDLVRLAEAIGDTTGFDCAVDVLRVGDAAVAAAPWQPFCEFGLKIKTGSALKPTLVAAFANGMVGYVPTPQGFEGGGYEPTLCRGSKLQPDSGGRIVEETTRLLGMV